MLDYARQRQGGGGSFSSRPLTSGSGFGGQTGGSGGFGGGGAATSKGIDQSRGRGFPERIDLNEIASGLGDIVTDIPETGFNAVATLGQAPGFIAERPFAVADALAERAGFGAPTAAIQRGIGGIPILGDVVGRLGDVFNSKMTGSVLNAYTARLLRQNARRDDNDVVEHDLPQAVQDALRLSPTPFGPLSQLAHLTGQPLTVGDLRRDALQRGFTLDDLADIEAGRKGDFDFGEKMIDANPVADMAGRIILDPTNLLFGAGVISKGFQGIGAVQKLTKLGALLPKAQSPLAAAQAIRAGEFSGATLAGLGTWSALSARRAVPGKRYFVANTGFAAGQLGVNALDQAGAGKNTPLSGFLEPLYELNRDIFNRHPLSDVTAFSVISAMKFPFRDVTGAIAAPIKPAQVKAFGGDIEEKVVDYLGAGKGKDYAARKAFVTDRLGGEDGLRELIYQAASRIVWFGDRKFAGIAPKIAESYRIQADSLDELLLHVDTIQRPIDQRLRAALGNNELAGDQVLEALKEWATNSRTIRDLSHGVEFKFTPDQVIDTWNEYRALATDLSKLMGSRGGVVLGLYEDVLAKEHLDVVGLMLRDASKGGKVSAATVQEILRQRPQLLQKVVTRKGEQVVVEEPFWAKYLVADAPDANLETLLKQLKRQERLAPTFKELTHEQRAWEAASDEDIANVLTEGPVRPDGSFNPAWQKPGAGTTHVSRFRDRVRRELGMKPTSARDAQAMRGHASVQAFERGVGRHLEDHGYAIERVDQAVGGFADNPPEPSVVIQLADGTSLEDLRQIAALTIRGGAKTLDEMQDAAMVVLDGQAAKAQGLVANAVDLRWQVGRMSARQLDEVQTVLGRHFPAGWTIDDTNGIIRLVVRDHEIGQGGLKQAVDALDTALAELFPPDPMAGHANLHPSRARVYAEMVGNDLEIGGKRKDISYLTTESTLAAIERDARLDPRYLSALRDAELELVPDGPGAARVAAGPGGAGSRAPGTPRFDRARQPGARAYDKAVESGGVNGGVDELREFSRAYTSEVGLLRPTERVYHEVDRDLGVRTSQAYEALPAMKYESTGAPRTTVELDATTTGLKDAKVPAKVRAAYQAFVDETAAQYRKLREAGYVFEPTLKDPYSQALDDAGKKIGPSPSQQALADLRDNKHLAVYAGEAAHPLMTDAQNVMFRAVHDALGHTQEGFQFGPRGELNAAIKHSQMYSPTARKAMLAETHGQNSVVNFSETVADEATGKTIAQVNKEKPGSIFADQKAALLPDEIYAEFEQKYLTPPAAKAWEKLQVAAKRPTSRAFQNATDDWLEALADEVDPLALPQHLQALATEITSKYPATGRRPTLLEALSRAESDLLRNGGNLGQTLFNAAKDAEVAGTISLPRFHPSLRGLPEEQLVELAAFERELKRHYPQYTLKLEPGVSIPYRPGQGVDIIREGLKHRTRVGYLLFEQGPLSKPAAFYAALLHPAHNSKLSRASKQALFNEMLPLGATPRQVNRFMAALEEHRKSIRIRNTPVFRTGDSLPADTINDIAAKVFPAEVLRKVGPENFWKVLDRSSSRYHRFLEQQLRQGGKRGQIARGLDSLYREGVPYFPFLPAQNNKVGYASRLVGKTFYHWFRFIMDPRWWAMNLMEADILAGTKYGIGATRLGGARRVTADVETLTHNKGRLPTAKDTFEDSLPDPFSGQAVPGLDNGYFDQRHLQGYITRSFQEGRATNVERVIDELPANDPVLQRLQERFPELPRDQWAAQLDETLYGFDTKGVKATIEDEAAKQLSREEIRDLEPFIQRLYELNEGTYQDIVRMLHGNPSRTNLERLGNSFWMFWPLSYQLKAGKWLFDVITGGASRRGSLKGAAYYAHLTELHKDRFENSPEYRAMFEDHPELWRAAQMFAPITPTDIGVSLSRPVRYLGANAGIFEEYASANDPVTQAVKVMSFGPIYTYELVRKLQREDSLPGSGF